MASKIVTLTITRQTKAVTRAGFGVLMIMGLHKIYNERVREYTDTASLITDGFDVTDPEYLAAVAFFAQNPNTGKVLIGRQQADQAVVSVLTVADTTTYTVTINGTPFAIVSDSDATNLEIIAALKTAIDLGSEPVTITDNLDGTMDVDPTVAGTAFTITVVGTNLGITKPFTATETVLAAYTAIKDENSEFYGVAMTSRTQADVESMAAQILTESRLFGTASSDALIINAVDTSSIAYILNNTNNERAFVVYHHLPSGYPEVAWFSRQLSTDPGSSTWKFKNLLGLAASPLTSTQSSAATGKEANTYESVGGVDITLEGTVASGEFIDIIRGIDWLEARMTERIFSKLVNLEKVPFTNAGIAIIEAEIRAQLTDGIAVGLLTNDPAPTVTKPLAVDIPTAEKLIRTLNGLEFNAFLQGAIHFVSIKGIVAV